MCPLAGVPDPGSFGARACRMDLATQTEIGSGSVRGWAEPHYLRSFGLMPAGAVLVYRPKNREELAVCYSLFAEAYHFACKIGSRQSMVIRAGSLLVRRLVIDYPKGDTTYRPLPDLIRGSGRVRYVRGFLLTNPKGSGAIVGARVVGRRNERARDECPGIELTSWD